MIVRKLTRRPFLTSKLCAILTVSLSLLTSSWLVSLFPLLVIYSLKELVPITLLQANSPEEWREAIHSHYSKHFSRKADKAKIGFLRHISQWQTFGSAFFEVKVLAANIKLATRISLYHFIVVSLSTKPLSPSSLRFLPSPLTNKD